MWTRLRQGVRWLFRRDRLDADMRREVAFHLEQEIALRVAGGATPEEARRSAVRDFGGVDQTREAMHDARGVTFWDTLVQDVRFGLRTLTRSPGYATAAVLTLALGIGANTAIFSVVNGVLLKPLPFNNSDNLVLIQESAPASGTPAANVSIWELFDYRKRLHTVQDLVEFHGMSFALLNQGEPDRVDTGVVSANFFDMLGVRPLLGRTFVPADDRLGADAVLVLSNAYWKTKFGGDRNVIGRVLQMNNRPHTIVGVLPDYPQYPRANDVYMPTSACPFRSAAEKNLAQGGHRSFGGLRVFGRLAPGVTEAQASAEIATVAASFSQEFPKDYTRLKGFTGRAHSLEDTLVVNARPMLLALAGTTMLVLLIACANVANLALARTVRRSRELALRTALGAGRLRLLRQLVTESVLVALVGGALGLALASFSLDLLVTFVGQFTARTSQIGIDGAVLAFTLGVSVLTGIVFGAAPALATRRNLAQAMRDGGTQSGDGTGRQRMRAGLVVAQVAVAFMLLVGAALLLTSFHRLSAVSLGYRTDNVMTAAIFGNFSHQQTPEDAYRDGNAILDRLRASGGVRAAALTSSVPLSNIQPAPQAVVIEHVASATRAFQADPNVASEGYFDALGIPLIEGRDFRRSDDAKAPIVAIINTSMAKFWNGQDPLGARFRLDGTDTWATVVGIVGDFHLYGSDDAVEPEFYVPFVQNGGNGGGRLIVRTDGAPGALVATIKAAVHSVDPDMPVKDLKTVEELRTGRLAAPRLTATLLTVFAAVALLITLAGITGVVATSVSQRTREFGVRMTLGASPWSVLRLVLRQAVYLVLIGLGIGIAGALAFVNILNRFLFATKATDIPTYALVALTLVITVVVACIVPARRATTIDPLRALRSE